MSVGRTLYKEGSVPSPVKLLTLDAVPKWKKQIKEH
jgi:hypothetical protein